MALYVTLPTEQSVRTCLQTELAICILEQALYPMWNTSPGVFMPCSLMMRTLYKKRL